MLFRSHGSLLGVHVWMTILLVRPHVNQSLLYNFILMVLRALALQLEWLRNIVDVGNCWFSKSKELQAGEFEALDPKILMRWTKG